MSFARGSSWPRDQTQVSCRQRLYLWATRESLFRERVFANVIKLRISRQGDYPGWSEWALNAITNVLVKERKEIWHTKRRQCEDTERIWGCWLWWLDVSTSQGMSEGIRSWKRQGMDFPLDPPNEVWPCRYALDFGSVILSWAFALEN